MIADISRGITGWFQGRRQNSDGSGSSGGGTVWFPEEPQNTRFEHDGWTLAEGERWDAGAQEGGVDLKSLRLDAPSGLDLTFQIGGSSPRLLAFPGLRHLAIDGDLSLGASDSGWEIMGTPMLVATRGREDGRLVYLLELSNVALCFASLPGRWVQPN